MPKGYTDITEIENYLLITIDASFQSQVGTTWLETVEDLIDKHTGKNFIADTTFSDKTYEVFLERDVSIAGTIPSIRDLITDDFVEFESLTIGTDLIASSKLLLYPLNIDHNNRIRTTNAGGITFPIGEQNLVVSAKWGNFILVPADIKWVATVLLSQIITESWTSEGEVQSVTLGRYTLTYKTKQQLRDYKTAIGILDRYMKRQ